jgi:imidazolonepropionase-like amidohydrolase
MMGPETSLGQINSGFLADLLLPDYNPLEHITILDDPSKSLIVMVNKGLVYRILVDGLDVDGLITLRLSSSL